MRPLWELGSAESRSTRRWRRSRTRPQGPLALARALFDCGPRLGPEPRRLLLVERERLRIDRDEVDLPRLLDAREAVQHVVEHEPRLPLDRVAETARARNRDLDRVAGHQSLVCELRRPVLLPGRV